MKRSSSLVVAYAALALAAPASVAAFACPSVYTLTSIDCARWCTTAATPSDGCVYYPSGGEFACASTSVGYCAPTESAACSVKCLATAFFVADTNASASATGKRALSLGLRGASGSFGRAEPIDAIDDLHLDNVTKLSIKDFLVENAAAPTHRIVLTNGRGLRASALETLELTNVALTFPSASILPPKLVTLVLNNNELAVAPTATQQDAVAQPHFPIEIFALKSLRHLDLRGNPKLRASSFTSTQLAFFRQLESFAADFKP